MACKVCGKENCMEHGGDVKKPLPKLNKYDHVKGGKKSVEENVDEAFGPLGEGKKELAQKGLKEMEERAKTIKPRKFAGGGEVEEHMHPDDEIHHHVAGELMDAIHNKDKKGIVECMRAMVMNMKGEK